MRDNPYKDMGKAPEQVDYAGENFIRFSGDTSKHAVAQMFAWEAQKAGVDVHLLAEPTKAEKLKVEYVGKKEEIKSSVAESILERYGGKEHLQAPPKALLLAQTEHYVEYSRSGKVIKGAEKPIVCSRYEEDVYINNHSQVWGSFWKEGQWGYQCCFSLIQNSYCTGETGKSINAPPDEKLAIVPASNTTKRIEQSDDEDDDDDDDDDDPMRNIRKKVVPEKTEEELEEERQARKESEKRRQKKRDRKRKKKQERKKRKERKSRKSSSSSSSDSDDSDSEQKKKKKLTKALKAEEERVKQVEALMKMDERKRPYNSMNAVETAPDEAELEAYHMKRKRDEDPMAFFV